MSTHKSSNMFHLVVSTKDLQSIDDLESYFHLNDFVQDYIITIESGTTGHQHLDSFVILTKTKRQDKFREQVIASNYKNIPKEELRNIKCTINYLDPDPMYAVGYALKEHPKDVRTTFTDEYLKLSETYFKENQERINKLKTQAKDKYKNTTMTIDTIANEYLQFCKQSNKTSLYYYSNPGDGYLLNKIICNDISFRNFMIIYNELIPFSLYQKINLDKLIEWTDTYLAEKGSIS